MAQTIIKNARFIDETVHDILLEDGIIQAIDAFDDNITDATIITAPADGYVSAGLIDIHTHSFDRFELYGDDCDAIGYKTGVTTVVDAGTSGSDNIKDFYEDVKDRITRVKAFINIAKPGIYAQYELADMKNIDEATVKAAIAAYPDFIVGLKARMSSSVVGKNDIAPLKIARHIADETELPVMVHIGNAPPKLAAVFEQLRKGDIVTHIFNPKPDGILDEQRQVRDFVFAGKVDGIIFDVGHGTESFGFKTYEAATAQGLTFDTISTDIYRRNRENGPVYDFATTLTKFLYLGMDKAEIIKKVTKNAAAAVGLAGLGEIKPGNIADFTFFRIVDGTKELTDSVQDTRQATQYFEPLAVYVKEKYLELF